ncbi:MAG: HlyD family efflux transporter periplasmic adaptor subunit [Planctomycetes bacterium]|nr:HlyD family efflux transporter periplasmic adaptor subunit [Planctomycetota bacterium]
MCFVVLAFAGCGRNSPSALQTAKVTRGDLTLSVDLRGELEAEKVEKVRRPQLYGSRGGVKITKLIPEGTDVKEGDLIVELDKADLQSNLKKAESGVKEETADLEKARKTLAVEGEKLLSEVKKLKADLEIKQLELGLVESLPTTSDMVQVETELETAKVVAKLEEQDYAPALQLHKTGHQTDEELEIAELEMKHARIDLERKTLIYNLVAKGADEFGIKRARLAVELARISLDQAKAKLDYEGKKLQEDIKAAEADLTLVKKERERRAEAVKAADVKAPCAGTVVYAKVWQGSGEEKITEGTAVWTHSPIIFLPDLHTMVAEVWVEESQIRLIKEGQSATIKMDAIKDVEFHGSVYEVGNVTFDKNETRGRSAWLYGEESSGIRVFKVKVRIKEKDERLKPGLNGYVKIISEEMKNVLSVPVHAVFRRDGQEIVYVREGRRWAVRPVETGKTAEGRVVIAKGLSEGETVSLAAPEAGR